MLPDIDKIQLDMKDDSSGHMNSLSRIAAHAQEPERLGEEAVDYLVKRAHLGSELKEPDSFTNKVLKVPSGKEKIKHGELIHTPSVAYYLPCYMRMKIRHLSEVNINDLEGAFKATMLFSIYYGNMDLEHIIRFTDKNKAEEYILLSSNHMPAMELNPNTVGIKVKHDYLNRLVTFVVRDTFRARLEGDVFWSPFEVLNMQLSFDVHSVTLYGDLWDQRKDVIINFNLMDTKIDTKLDYSQSVNLGSYQLAPKFIKSFFTNTTQPPRLHVKRQFCRCTGRSFEVKLDCDPPQLQDGLRGDNSLCTFSCAHFIIPIFRHPSCFIPVNLVLLGLFNAVYFFPQVRGQIGSLSLLTLGYVALIPAVRSSIPDTPKKLFIQIILYLQLIAMLITLGQLFLFRNHQYDVQPFVWYREPLFYAVSFMNLCIFVGLASLFICHLCGWQSRLKEDLPNRKRKALVRRNWKNSACDRYFKRFKDKKNIRAI